MMASDVDSLIMDQMAQILQEVEQALNNRSEETITEDESNSFKSILEHVKQELKTLDAKQSSEETTSKITQMLQVIQQIQENLQTLSKPISESKFELLIPQNPNKTQDINELFENVEQMEQMLKTNQLDMKYIAQINKSLEECRKAIKRKLEEQTLQESEGFNYGLGQKPQPVDIPANKIRKLDPIVLRNDSKEKEMARLTQIEDKSTFDYSNELSEIMKDLEFLLKSRNKEVGLPSTEHLKHVVELVSEAIQNTVMTKLQSSHEIDKMCETLQQTQELIASGNESKVELQGNSLTSEQSTRSGNSPETIDNIIKVLYEIRNIINLDKSKRFESKTEESNVRYLSEDSVQAIIPQLSELQIMLQGLDIPITVVTELRDFFSQVLENIIPYSDSSGNGSTPSMKPPPRKLRDDLRTIIKLLFVTVRRTEYKDYTCSKNKYTCNEAIDNVDIKQKMQVMQHLVTLITVDSTKLFWIVNHIISVLGLCMYRITSSKKHRLTYNTESDNGEFIGFVNAIYNLSFALVKQDVIKAIMSVEYDDCTVKELRRLNNSSFIRGVKTWMPRSRKTNYVLAVFHLQSVVEAICSRIKLEGKRRCKIEDRSQVETKFYLNESPAQVPVSDEVFYNLENNSSCDVEEDVIPDTVGKRDAVRSKVKRDRGGRGKHRKVLVFLEIAEKMKNELAMLSKLSADDEAKTEVVEYQELQLIVTVIPPSVDSLFASLAQLILGPICSLRKLSGLADSLRSRTLSFMKDNQELFFRDLNKLYDETFPNHVLDPERAFEDCLRYLSDPNTKGSFQLMLAFSTMTSTPIVVVFKEGKNPVRIEPPWSSGVKLPVHVLHCLEYSHFDPIVSCRTRLSQGCFQGSSSFSIPFKDAPNIFKSQLQSQCFWVASWTVQRLDPVFRDQVDYYLSNHNIDLCFISLDHSFYSSLTCKTMSTKSLSFSANYLWFTLDSPSERAITTGFLLHKQSQASLTSVRRLTKYLVSATVTYNHACFTVFGCRFTKVDGNDIEKKKLMEAMNQVPSSSHIILLGTFKAQIGRFDTKDDEKSFIGRTLFHKTTNKNGEFLKEMALKHSLCFVSTFGENDLYFKCSRLYQQRQEQLKARSSLNFENELKKLDQRINNMFLGSELQNDKSLPDKSLPDKSLPDKSLPDKSLPDKTDKSTRKPFSKSKEDLVSISFQDSYILLQKTSLIKTKTFLWWENFNNMEYEMKAIVGCRISVDDKAVSEECST